MDYSKQQNISFKVGGTSSRKFGLTISMCHQWNYQMLRSSLPKESKRDVEIRKSEFKAFLDGLDKGPKSLSIICRKSIRQQLLLAAEDSEIESRVNLLPIPAKMKCFLGLTDYAQDKEVIQLELNRSVRQHTFVSSNLVQAYLMSRIQSSQRHSYIYYDSDDDYDDYLMFDDYYDNW
ncbi:unnamed protein product [Mytilus edulis]|uniref:SOCS box domain-containing protein n=1 Tax=Mytilus edulis TaxID=6550 RepID=A0A8S3RLB8_MYTED|nr:unnamed protein product [Mytilus edulis]